MSSHTVTRGLAVTTTGMLCSVALFPTGAALASSDCGPGATLVADGICEVTFTETPVSAWTPPAGITKLQALLVGGGGAVGNSNEYGGGGGDVDLVELGVDGNVTVQVGVGGLNAGNVASTGSSVTQGALSGLAAGGENSRTDGAFGGDSGNGNEGFSGIGSGAGAGAGGDGTDSGAGDGLIVNEIDSDFDLFADDDRCFGGGGVEISASRDGVTVSVEIQNESCGGDNGGGLTLPSSAVAIGNLWNFVGADDEFDLTAIVPNTGNGGSNMLGLKNIHQDGSDGLVVLRYDTEAGEDLAPTGGVANDVAGVAGLGYSLVALGAIGWALLRRRTV